jgi:glutathione synthase
MAKQFLYIVDPLPSLNVGSDTTLAIMEEAGSRNIKNFACEIKDIFLESGQLYFMCSEVTLPRGYIKPPVYLEPLTKRASDEFHVIFMRKDPPVNELFWAALFMLRCHGKNTVMVNNPDGILLANEKLFGQKIVSSFFPETLVTSNKKLIIDFAEDHEKIVIKPLFQAGGAGVLVFDRNDRNLISATEVLTNQYTSPVMVQSYIKNARLGDKRIILLGGEAIGAIMRVPPEDDHRANFHAGGVAIKASITDRERTIIEALKPHLLSLGLHLVGIDIIDGYLTEINVTSPTCVIEIENLSKKTHERPLRARILDYIEELIA